MNIFGSKPKEGVVYSSSYLGIWLNVYPDRIEFLAGASTQSVSLSQISSVEQGSFGFNKVTIFTTSGHKYSVATGKKKELREAILSAQSKFNQKGSGSASSEADELLKLSKLMKQGIISEDEFNKKKKQLLG